MKYRTKESIDTVAKAHGFKSIDYQGNIGMVSYSDGSCRINVYLSKMTVATCLKHPKKGATQLFRKNVSFEQLQAIFAYPRIHTGRGYYKKKK